MAFEGLTEKLNAAFKRLRGKGRLTENDVREAMREVRLALLEADVSYKVVKDFVASVTERAVGSDVLDSLTPAQQVVKIVNEELTSLMGGANAKITMANNGPTVVMMVGLQGAGKTTTTANLGCGLARLGKQVVMLDTDIGLRNLDVVLGLENRIVYNLVDVIEGSCRLSQALIKDKRYPSLQLLPSAQTRDKSSVSPEQMKKLIDSLRGDFDYILLDCPAGIEQGFKNAIAGADRALVVTTPEVSAIRDADRIIGLLGANEVKKTELIVNRLRMDMVKRGDMMNINDVTDILAIDLIGAVPDDEQIVISTNQGEPLVGSDCLAGKAFANICHRILGEEVPFLDLEIKSSVWGKLKEIFKKN